MTLRDKILDGQNWVPGVFQALGSLKKVSPGKMLSNGTLNSEIGDIFFFMNFFGFWVKTGTWSGFQASRPFLVRFLLTNDVE